MLVEFSDFQNPNLFVIGNLDAGKSSLLKTIAISLAVTNKQSQVQLVILDGKNDSKQSSLEALSYLPHVLCQVSQDSYDHEEVFNFLLDELNYRQGQNMTSPGIVVLIDEVVSILKQLGDTGSEILSKLLQRGSASGIYIVMTTQEPDSELLTQTMRLNIPLQIYGKSDFTVGKFSSQQEFRHVAEYLMGQGDFLALCDDKVTHFQAAYLGNYDFHLILESLHRNRPSPILAHSYSIENQIQQQNNNEISHVQFLVDDKSVELTDEGEKQFLHEYNNIKDDKWRLS